MVLGMPGADAVELAEPFDRPQGDRRLVVAGESFVYAYYEGIDKVAHEYGLGDAYDAELVFVDRLVEFLIERAKAGAR